MNEISANIPTHLTDTPQKMERAKNVMGKDDFMKLLMTQLQNQDPLRPMDHHEFSAQLAQFGSLEQLTNIQKSIEGLSNGYGEGTKFNALSLIGKRVDASTSEVDLISGQSVSLRFTNKNEVQPGKAIVYGDGGKIVRELPIDPKSKSNEIEWDGKDQDGKQLPPGKYTFRVQGTDKAGQATEMSSELSGRVAGVDMNGKTPTLIVKTASGEVRIELSKVKNVSSEDKDSSAPKTSNTPPSSRPTSSPGTSVDLSQLKQIVEGGEESDVASNTENAETDNGMWEGIPSNIPVGGFR